MIFALGGGSALVPPHRRGAPACPASRLPFAQTGRVRCGPLRLCDPSLIPALQLRPQVRLHKVTLPGHICAVVVTTLVLEGWSNKLDPTHSVLTQVQREGLACGLCFCAPCRCIAHGSSAGKWRAGAPAMAIAGATLTADRCACTSVRGGCVCVQVQKMFEATTVPWRTRLLTTVDHMMQEEPDRLVDAI